MKKIILFVFLFFNCFSSFADNDYENDYTLIDCVGWMNDTWVVFDSTKPYATLKEWIEKTIEYINSNINYSWNINTASGKIFNIKVACSFNDILNQSIELNFDWYSYNNQLIIEWIDENSLIFKEVDFKLWKNAWNIIFKNAKFLNENKPYFYDFIPEANHSTFWEGYHPNTNWIKILDSFISLKNSQNLWEYINYNSYSYKRYNRLYRDSLYNYSNKQIIENSIIDIELDDNFDFYLPVFLKNSKLNFKSINSSWTLNIKFIENWNINNWWELNYSVFLSNEINLWENNLFIEDTNKIAFLNNSIKNFDSIDITWGWIFINNFFDNNESIDISDTHELYNNIFKSGFTDTYDIFNNRKNFSQNNVQDLWIGWIYKRLRDNKYFNIDINSADLYKEITWKNLANWLWDIYIIFNY